MIVLADVGGVEDNGTDTLSLPKSIEYYFVLSFFLQINLPIFAC